MANNSKDTKQTRHIFRIIRFVRNGEECYLHKIVWCEGDIQLVYNVSKNSREGELNPRLQYAMVRLKN